MSVGATGGVSVGEMLSAFSVLTWEIGVDEDMGSVDVKVGVTGEH